MGPPDELEPDVDKMVSKVELPMIENNMVDMIAKPVTVSESVDATGGEYIKQCDHNTCRFGGVCDYDDEGVPHCICSYHCPSDNEQGA